MDKLQFIIRSRRKELFEKKLQYFTILLFYCLNAALVHIRDLFKNNLLTLEQWCVKLQFCLQYRELFTNTVNKYIFGKLLNNNCKSYMLLFWSSIVIKHFAVVQTVVILLDDFSKSPKIQIKAFFRKPVWYWYLKRKYLLCCCTAR